MKEPRAAFSGRPNHHELRNMHAPVNFDKRVLSSPIL